MGRLCGGIIFNLDILKACLKERACNTNVELDKAEVNLREAFNSVQTEVLKTSSIILVQKVSELARCSEFLNSISLGFFKKGTKLVVPLLKMVKGSLLSNCPGLF